MGQTTEGFKNFDTLTKWVKYFLYIQIVVVTVAIASNFMEYQLLSDYQNGVYTSQEKAIADGETNDQRQQLISLAYIIVFIISGFLILKWIYRANYNARQLGASGMKFTPGWSVGWYFIPIFNLWKPYQAMREIWKASHAPTDWTNVATSSDLRRWWFFWIVSSVITNISFRFSMNTEGLNKLIILNVVDQASELFSIPLAIVTLILINKIYLAQLKNLHKKVNKADEFINE